MSNREIVTTRLIDAPRVRIFEAFSDPDHLARWWGPGATAPSRASPDLRAGGVFGAVQREAQG